jgi:sRNA-binding carbon storage regulator CsrA
MLLIARMVGDSIYIGDDIEIKILATGKLTNNEQLKNASPIVDMDIPLLGRQMHSVIGVNAPRHLRIARFLKPN